MWTRNESVLWGNATFSVRLLSFLKSQGDQLFRCSNWKGKRRCQPYQLQALFFCCYCCCSCWKSRRLDWSRFFKKQFRDIFFFRIAIFMSFYSFLMAFSEYQFFLCSYIDFSNAIYIPPLIFWKVWLMLFLFTELLFLSFTYLKSFLHIFHYLRRQQNPRTNNNFESPLLIGYQAETTWNAVKSCANHQLPRFKNRPISDVDSNIPLALRFSFLESYLGSIEHVKKRIKCVSKLLLFLDWMLFESKLLGWFYYMDDIMFTLQWNWDH